MKAYKGFNRDMTCRDFQFEEGKTYEEENAKLCDSGFHACVDPLDCFNYYYPGQSVYREVELDDNGERHADDSKVCGKKITIGAEIGLPGIIKAHFDYVKSNCTMERTDPKQATAGYSGAATAGNFGAATAGYRGAATAGDSGAATAGNFGAATAGNFGAATAGDSGAATAGYFGAATAGDSGAATAGYSGAATAGYRGAATAGDSGAATAGYSGAATAGNFGAATAGNFGAATAGNFGAATAGNFGAATAGDSGAATSRGKVSVGENGVGTVRGDDVMIRGGKGAMLTIAVESKTSFDIVSWGSFVIDGKMYKPDTWYTLRNGEIVEAEE